MKMIRFLGVLLLAATFLTGCQTTQSEVFGIPTDIWKTLTNEQKLEVIRGYNQRSAAERRERAQRTESSSAAEGG